MRDGSPITGRYAAAAHSIVPVASATNIFTITGSATKSVILEKLILSGTAATAVDAVVRLIKQSTADTSGSSTTMTNVGLDDNLTAATATVLTYTGNPTTGTPVGDVMAFNLALIPAATAVGNPPLVIDFSNNPIILRGATSVLAINLNGATITTGSMNFTAIWTEQ